MGKNNKKNFQNRFNQPKQQSPVFVKPSIQLTSEEKERLRLEGEKVKGILIAEGDQEKQRLIQEGKTQVELELSSLELKKEKLLSEFKIEAKTLMLAEIEIQRQSIIEEAEKIRENNKFKEIEISGKISAFEQKSTNLAEKVKTYTLDLAKFEVAKTEYRLSIMEEQKQYVENLKLEIETLSSEKNAFKAQLKDKQNENDLLRADINNLENEIDNNITQRKNLFSLKLQLKEQESVYQALNSQYIECLNRVTDQEITLKTFGPNPQRAIEENKNLQLRLKTALDKLSSYPPEEEINQLRIEFAKNEKLKDRFLELSLILKEKENELEKFIIDEDDIKNKQNLYELLKSQKLELEKEVERLVGLYKNQTTNVFSSLSKIDDNFLPSKYPSSVSFSLRNICDNFRNYLASRTDKENLYYNIKNIRTFIAGFASSRLLILKGMSGTGKSSLPNAFMDYVKCVTNSISVQSSWKDRNDLLGFYNDFKKQYKETDFLKLQYQATIDSDNIHCIVLDEMNLSKIEYYFADYLSVLEKDENKWIINLISEEVQGAMPKFIVDGNLQIRNNTWYIGTANDDDSVQTITDKVYDRAIVIDFKNREERFKPTIRTHPIELSNTAFQKLLSNAVTLSDKLKADIDFIVKGFDDRFKKYFSISFGNRISKQIDLFVPAYIACGGDTIEAIDIIFTTKVIRKLEGRYDETTKRNLDSFLDELNKDYPNAIDFESTKEALKKLINSR